MAGERYYKKLWQERNYMNLKKKAQKNYEKQNLNNSRNFIRGNKPALLPILCYA